VLGISRGTEAKRVATEFRHGGFGWNHFSFAEQYRFVNSFLQTPIRRAMPTVVGSALLELLEGEDDEDREGKDEDAAMRLWQCSQTTEFTLRFRWLRRISNPSAAVASVSAIPYSFTTMPKWLLVRGQRRERLKLMGSCGFCPLFWSGGADACGF